MENANVLISCLILCLFSTLAKSQYYYTKTLPSPLKREFVTNLHFFFHDTLSGKNPTAVLVAKANLDGRRNDTSPTPFSSVLVVDDPLTTGPDPNSTLIGNAKGMYVSSGRDDPMLTLYIDFGFTTGKFKGSSISVFSRNPITEKERELAVVGGRGKFKMARGLAHLNTYYVNTTNGDAIVEYNVTVIHYYYSKVTV